MLGLPVSMFTLVVPGVMGTVGKTFGGSVRDHGLGGRHVGVVVHILDTCIPVGRHVGDGTSHYHAKKQANKCQLHHDFQRLRDGKVGKSNTIV